MSFFDFIQEEFYPPAFDVSEYKEELRQIKKPVSTESLTRLLESNPRVIDIFEQLFQLRRFTNAQYIHFCFDVPTLNSADENRIADYAKQSILQFENGSRNEVFCEIFDRYGNSSSDRTRFVFNIKRAIPEYIQKCIKDKSVLHLHLSNSEASRRRVARYLVESLNLNDLVAAMDVEKFLTLKRIPRDTKSIHGRYGSMRVAGILAKQHVANADALVQGKILSPHQAAFASPMGAFAFATERAIDGLLKRKDEKPKLFDFIILHAGKPRVLIETNFYSTSGTKIGINQGEYVDLLQDTKQFNVRHGVNLRFMWITDGNYWLTRDGEARFNNLKRSHFKGSYELLNYNQFQESLPAILAEIRDSD